MSQHIELGAKENSITMGALKEKEPCCNKTQKEIAAMLKEIDEKKPLCVNEIRKRFGLPPLPDKGANIMLTPIDE